ncbi:MAG: hypothetical protein KIT44_02840 [Opitutaceae bacterium]|nr:hypothetical protein [Opitutaceae bacterium]
MFDTLTKYVEKKPRSIVICALTFIATLSGVSDACFYVLSQIVENERSWARQEVILAKARYENEAKNLQARARLNTENISRSLDSFIPVLKEQVESIRTLKIELGSRAKEDDAVFPSISKLPNLSFAQVSCCGSSSQNVSF